MISKSLYVITGIVAFAAFGAGFAVESKHKRWNLDTFNPIETSLLDLRIHSKIAQIAGREPEKINRVLSLRINADLALIDGVLSGKIGRISDDKKGELCKLIARLAQEHAGEAYWAPVSDEFNMLRNKCPRAENSNPDLTGDR